LAVEPTVVVEVQAVAIPMSWVNLTVRNKDESQFYLDDAITRTVLIHDIFHFVPPLANAAGQVSGPFHPWRDLYQPRIDSNTIIVSMQYTPRLLKPQMW
jgi:hypothetical protein